MKMMMMMTTGMNGDSLLFYACGGFPFYVTRRRFTWKKKAVLSPYTPKYVNQQQKVALSPARLDNPESMRGWEHDLMPHRCRCRPLSR